MDKNVSYDYGKKEIYWRRRNLAEKIHQQAEALAGQELLDLKAEWNNLASQISKIKQTVRYRCVYKIRPGQIFNDMNKDCSFSTTWIEQDQFEHEVDYEYHNRLAEECDSDELIEPADEDDIGYHNGVQVVAGNNFVPEKGRPFIVYLVPRFNAGGPMVKEFLGCVHPLCRENPQDTNYTIFLLCKTHANHAAVDSIEEFLNGTSSRDGSNLTLLMEHHSKAIVESYKKSIDAMKYSLANEDEPPKVIVVECLENPDDPKYESGYYDIEDDLKEIYVDLMHYARVNVTAASN
jgi:hypothetical protein